MMSLKRDLSRLSARLSSPVAFGLAVFLTFPGEVRHADMASLIAEAGGHSERWRAHMNAAPAGSLHRVEIPFRDPVMTGATQNAASFSLPNGEQGDFRPGRHRRSAARCRTRHPKSEAGPGNFRITRQPPKDFSAGSILDRTSFLQQPDNVSMAFVEPAIEGREIEIAMAFHPKREVIEVPGVSSMLAGLVTNTKPDVLATAYAPPPPDYARQSPFASILTDESEEAGRFIPPLAGGDHAWAATALPPAAFSDREQQCLAAGIYFEARGEPVKGQAAVAQVILNRVRNPAFPDSICGVVYQNVHWRNRCQFSFACDGIKDRVRSPRHWDMAEEIAMAVTAGKIWLAEVGSSSHYHATYVRPGWARRMERVGRIGLHIFYRTYGGGWS